MEKCYIEENWFYVEDGLAEEIKKEVDKTISFLKKIGYHISIETPHKFKVDVIWIIALKENVEHFTFGFQINKQTNNLIETFVTIQNEAGDTLRESFYKKHGDYSISSGKRFDLFYPLSYLRSQKIRLLYI